MGLFYCADYLIKHWQQLNTFSHVDRVKTTWSTEASQWRKKVFYQTLNLARLTLWVSDRLLEYFRNLNLKVSSGIFTHNLELQGMVQKKKRENNNVLFIVRDPLWMHNMLNPPWSRRATAEGQHGASLRAAKNRKWRRQFARTDNESPFLLWHLEGWVRMLHT